MGVPLRRGEAGVSQQLLYATQVGPGIQQVGGKGMPEGMGRGLLEYPTLREIFLDHSGNATGRQSAAQVIEEEGIAFPLFHQLTPVRQVCF
jgi:hypothetical protein